MIKSLNGVRGVAVLLVFTAHTPIRLVIGDFGHQAVYIFFVLSSFLLTLSILNGVNNIKGYAIKRFLRIYPLYGLIVTLIALITSIGIWDYFTNMLFLQGLFNTHFILSVSWSLIIEVQMYILLPIILYIISRNNKFNYLFVILIFILAYAFRTLNIGHYLYNSNNGSMKIIDGNIYEVIDIFMVGIILAFQYKKDKLLNIKWYITLLSLALFIVVPFLLTVSQIDRAYQVIYILIPIYSVLIYILFTAALQGKEKYLSYILNLNILSFYAEISYSFYLVHLPILIFFRENFKMIPYVLAGVIAFFVITFISYILYTFWERYFLQLYKGNYKK